MEAPPFPLPLGHVFGPSAGDLQRHNGRQWPDGENLRKWQAAYCGRWRRPQNGPTGVFDGLTQRGVIEVQRTLGVPVTGLLGPDEWAAVWEREPPPPKQPEPKPVPTLTAAQHRARLRDRLAYWKRFSRYRIRYGSDPDAPPWYPGRPFGPYEYGPHVTRVQEILGFKTTGRFSLEMARRIRGLQRAYGLPESGLVDVRMACLLDPVNGEDPPPS